MSHFLFKVHNYFTLFYLFKKIIMEKYLKEHSSFATLDNKLLKKNPIFTHRMQSFVFSSLKKKKKIVIFGVFFIHFMILYVLQISGKQT